MRKSELHFHFSAAVSSYFFISDFNVLMFLCPVLHHVVLFIFIFSFNSMNHRKHNLASTLINLHYFLITHQLCTINFPSAKYLPAHEILPVYFFFFSP